MGRTLGWMLAVLVGMAASMTCAAGVPFGESRAAPLFGDREAVPLIQVALPGAEKTGLERTGAGDQNGRASLFADGPRRGLLAPLPGRARRALGADIGTAPATAPLAPGVRGLKAVIARAEAGPAGYDAVVWSARIAPPKAPTRMTLAEIFAWIEATPGQNHAIGRYQFIPKTLRWLVARAGVPAQARFSPDLQDRLAHMLLLDAGLEEFLDGTLPRTAFMNNLARTWAGLPNSTGRSHYHGIAGNKATMSWAQFDAHMRALFAQG